MKYLICNFKNKLLKNDIVKYNAKLGGLELSKTKLVICPPLPFVSLFDKRGYYLGCQDVSSFYENTITGEVTGEQIRSLDVDYVIVGHSERREYRHEINIDFINKINNILANDMKVVYCIGETLSDREKGNTYMVLEKQISEVLNNVSIKDIIVAYEPVWAIGTGVIPKIEDIADTMEFIKDTLMEKYEVKLPLLYGGSVNPNNIKELNSIKGVDGFLVGGASLDTDKVKDMLEEMEK